MSQTFSTTKIPDIAKEVLKTMMFTQEEAKKELQSTLDQPWNFAFFLKKPIFNLIDDSVIPVSTHLLENALADRLYWDIRECFPKEDTNFQRFFGRPFELYAQDVFEESCKASPLPYAFIPEMVYGRSQTRSPDVVIRLGSKLLAVEVKSYRLRYIDTMVNGSLESIEEDRIKMVVKPIQQVYNRVKELLNGECPDIDFSGIEEIYLVVVNQGEFPTLRSLERRNTNDWNQLNGINLPTYIYHMGIEEAEFLASFLKEMSLFLICYMTN